MGGFAIWWNLIVVAIEFVFRQKPEVISRTYNQHKGTFYETTEVTVADVAPNKVKVVEAAIKRNLLAIILCWNMPSYSIRVRISEWIGSRSLDISIR